jgi:hypothetical protein
MSMLERRSEIQKVESKASELVTLCKKDPLVLDIVSCGHFTRKEITLGDWGFDKGCLLENLRTWNYSESQIEDALTRMVSRELIHKFTWRNRIAYDFPYKNQVDFQNMFIKAIENSETFTRHLTELQKQIDGYLLKKVKEEKNENLTSVLRLLIVLPLPEIGVRLELGSVAQFHFKSILGEKWVDQILELMQNKIVLTRLNFLSSNVAYEYFIPEYARSTVSNYVSYANVLLRRKLETLISLPLLDDKLQVLEKHKSTFLKMGLCYRKWTIPKVELTEDFIPTIFLQQILIEQTTEIPELIIKSYPEDELWTYYLIGRALIDSKHSVYVSSPYVDSTTLTHFVKSVPKDVDIRILTSRTGGEHKEKRFYDCLREMWKEGYRIEAVKMLRESNRVPLHDRYVIQDNKVVLDLPGDLKTGFSGKDKAENVKWIPFEDNVVVYNDQFDKLWNLNFTETDFASDPSAMVGVKLSFTKPDLVSTYKVVLVDGKIRKEEKTISFDQFSSQS